MRRHYGRERKQRVDERLDDQLTCELEFEDERLRRQAAGVDRDAKSEGEISEGEIVKMDEEMLEQHEDLESIPFRSPDVCVASPSRDMVVEDEDAVGRWWSEDVVELETGPHSSTDISARLMPRNPAQVRARSPGTPDGPVARPRMPDGRSLARDEVDAGAPGVVRQRMSDSPIERDKKPRVDEGALSHTSVLAHAEGSPRSLDRRPKIVILEDDRC